MSKISLGARILNHTLTTASATFSIPTSEDYTDGTWTINDLALSEIGVNEADKKAYMRLDDEIKEIQFVEDLPIASNYVEYKALLSQAGTSAPDRSVLVNGITGTWSYSSVGIYHFTATGQFTDVTKVEVDIQNIQVQSYTMTNRVMNVMSAYRLDANTIEVRTGRIDEDGSGNLINYTSGGAYTDITNTLSDAILSYTPFTVRVWT